MLLSIAGESELWFPGSQEKSERLWTREEWKGEHIEKMSGEKKVGGSKQSFLE